jgi:HSP20 family protein
MQFDPGWDSGGLARPRREVTRLAVRRTSGFSSRHSFPMNVVPMDAWRDADGLHIEFELPGVEPDAIEVTVEREVLTIRAERRPSFSAEAEVVVAERLRGVLGRSIFLGADIDTESIVAEFTNGVLALTVPLAEAKWVAPAEAVNPDNTPPPYGDIRLDDDVPLEVTESLRSGVEYQIRDDLRRQWPGSTNEQLGQAVELLVSFELHAISTGIVNFGTARDIGSRVAELMGPSQ